MSTKITNPVLKQMIAEIAGKTGEGRMVDVGWNRLTEAKKLKKEAAPAKQDDTDLDSILGDEGGSKAAPTANSGDAAPAPAPADAGAKPAADAGADIGGEPAAGAEQAPAADNKAPAADADADADAGAGADEEAPEDPEKAKEDAEDAKEELEKAKAEKERAEKEIQKQSYIKLGSNAGTQFLLSKILDHAFKTNTIDALAGEMVQKLKIETPEDMDAFSEDTAMFRVLPGMAELLSAMKTMATKKPETPEEAPEEKAPSLKEMFNRIYPIVPLR